MIPPARMDSIEENQREADSEKRLPRPPAAFAAAAARANCAPPGEDARSPIARIQGIELYRPVLGVIVVGALLALLWVGALVAFPDRIARAFSPETAMRSDVLESAPPAAVTMTPTMAPTRTLTATRTPSPTPTSTATATAAATLTSAPLTPIYVPSRLRIPAIDVDAPVKPVSWSLIPQGGTTEPAWDVASDAVGWHLNSATPGQGGNVVLAGHHNVDGMVFRDLYRLDTGDEIRLFAGSAEYAYRVREVMIVLEDGASDAQRQENARWIGPFPEERLTLISCWPPDDNTHRVIVVAVPRAGAG